jgi:hypothetical protein
MSWGGPSKQGHYVAGRNLREVRRDNIEGVCRCGYLTLRPTSDFEEFNGGLTVKRSQVRIVRDDGSTVLRLRGGDINYYGCCNACVNDWK